MLGAPTAHQRYRPSNHRPHQRQRNLRRARKDAQRGALLWSGIADPVSGIGRACGRNALGKLSKPAFQSLCSLVEQQAKISFVKLSPYDGQMILTSTDPLPQQRRRVCAEDAEGAGDSRFKNCGNIGERRQRSSLVWDSSLRGTGICNSHPRAGREHYEVALVINCSMIPRRIRGMSAGTTTFAKAGG